MDANGARHLLERLRLAITHGTTVELVGEPPDDRLRVGDRGVVEQVAADGSVTIAWGSGFSSDVDPRRTSLRRVGA
jgi:hypothetical protein